MAEAPDQNRVATLADLKDAIENLALAQMQTGVAIANILYCIIAEKHSDNEIRAIEDNNDEAFAACKKILTDLLNLKAD